MIRIITSLVAVLVISSVQAQINVAGTPRLVIGITIDQLRGDYLELFEENFSENGFKRLKNSGLMYQNMRFDFTNVNTASAIATIHTGANPSFTGIDAPQKFSRDKHQIVSILHDENATSATRLTTSALYTSTLADELKVASQGKANVYAVAPDAYQALLSIGHTDGIAIWIDDFSGKWLSSSRYNPTEWISERINSSASALDKRIKNLSWRPSLSIDKYKLLPYDGGTFYTFNHTFGSEKSPYLTLKKTPLVNDEVANMATSLIKEAALGTRSMPDFLSLTFYLGNAPQVANKLSPLETQDAYYRLDRTLGQFFEVVDKTVGLQNALIFVTSTGNFLQEEPKNRATEGGTIFYPNRCTSLLNMMLMAEYGKEQWVEGFFNNQIFLDRKLIERKNLNIKEIQNKSAEFVEQFTGVQDVVTSSNFAENSNWSDVREGLHKKNIGDLLLRLQSGTRIVDENTTTPQPDFRERNATVRAPIFFFGYNVRPQKVYREINAREIAPSVAYTLRIRSPNAASGSVLPELIKH